MSPTFPKIAGPSRTTRASQDRHAERVFRAEVWTRDHGRDRATGVDLSRAVHEHPERRGEVCHLLSRGAYPELALEPSNAVLLSAANHCRSDARGNNLLKMTDPDTAERATDGRKAIRFTLYDGHNRVLWTRIS